MTPEVPYPSRFAPWLHQIRTVREIDTRSHFMLAHRMGTGKTKTLCDYMYYRRPLDVFIGAPKRVCPVWVDQISKHNPFPGRKPLRVVDMFGDALIEDRVKNAEAIIARRRPDEPLIFIANYDAIGRYDTVPTPNGGVKKVPGPLWRFMLRPWDLAIADESHRIKTFDAAASLAFNDLGRRSQKRVCMTGTPMGQSPLDLFGQFRFLDPNILGPNWYRFRAMHAVMHPVFKSKILRFRDEMIESLHATFHAHADVVHEDDVLKLPPQIHQHIYVELSAKTRCLYKQMADDFVAQVDGGIVTAANAAVKLCRLQQLTSGYLPPPELDDFGQRVENVDGAAYKQISTEKLDAIADMMTDLPDEECIVVFTRFKNDLDSIHKAAKIAGRRSMELSGRRDDLNGPTWTAGPETVLAVQIQAGGAGIDLTRARYTVYYSFDYSLINFDQSMSRTRRSGQDRTCFYYYLTASRTIDGAIQAALSQRKKVVDSIVHNPREQLESALEPDLLFR